VVRCVDLIGCTLARVGEAVRAVLALAAAPRLAPGRAGVCARLTPGVVVVARRTVMVILDGHVVLDLECFDRSYLNGWVPTLLT
jgi:hypothetical protein